MPIQKSPKVRRFHRLRPVRAVGEVFQLSEDDRQSLRAGHAERATHCAVSEPTKVPLPGKERWHRLPATAEKQAGQKRGAVLGAEIRDLRYAIED